MTASSRPDERPRFESTLEVIAGLGLLANIAIIASSWSSLPERVPQHFGAAGNPDAYGSKANALIPLLLALFLYLLFTGVQRIPVRFYKFPSHITADKVAAQLWFTRMMLASLKAISSVFLVCGTWLTVQVALGHREGLGFWFLPGVLIATLLPPLVFASAARRQRKVH